MKVTIGDLDYYFAEQKGLQVNVDVQKISSYHKQKGDSVNFVTTQHDIYRPYDIYYIIKENKNTPNPPMEFFANPKVRWWGEAYVMKQNWKMPDAMLACRPDYLLYPERLTRETRAEQIRLLGNNGNLLPVVQDWSNTLKDKNYIVVDKDIWFAKDDVLVEALKRIEKVPNICFAAPIPILRIIKSKKVFWTFGQLQFSARSQFEWSRINAEDCVDAISFILYFKNKYPTCSIPHLPVKYTKTPWQDAKEAKSGINLLRQLIITCKRLCIYVDIIGPKKRNETPFFFIPELMEDWCKLNFKMAWLEYLSIRFKVEKNYISGSTEGNKIHKWHPLFRDAIRQTYDDPEFLLIKWDKDKVSDIEIPGKLGKETFKFGF